MFKEQAICLSQLFSFHIVGKTKMHVLMVSDSLSCFLFIQQNKLKIHKGQIMIPKLAPVAIFEDAKCFFDFHLNIHSFLSCIRLPCH